MWHAVYRASQLNSLQTLAADKVLKYKTNTLDRAMKSIKYNDLKTVHLLVGIYDIVQTKIRTFVQSILSQFAEITSIQFNPDFISSLSSYIASYYEKKVDGYQIEAIDNILNPSMSNLGHIHDHIFNTTYIIKDDGSYKLRFSKRKDQGFDLYTLILFYSLGDASTQPSLFSKLIHEDDFEIIQNTVNAIFILNMCLCNSE